MSVLQSFYSSPLLYPLHRLDRDTTGVLLVARDRETARSLSHEFACRHVGKLYLAAGYDSSFTSCHHPASGLILSNMVRDERGLFHAEKAIIRPISDHVFPDVISTSKEYPAATGYDVIRHGNHVVVMQCKLYSGKTHQIRVHLRDVLGVEILNDPKYGRKRKLDLPIDSRALFLHCQEIKIRYCGKERHFSAPIPPYFRNLIQSL